MKRQAIKTENKPWLLWLLCALLLVTALPSVQALAEETVPEPVRVGFFSMDGYHMIDEAGVHSGYGYEYLQLLARYSNLRFEYVGYDKGWNEMLEMLRKGEIDLLTSAQKTPEREQEFAFSSNLMGTSAAILTTKEGNTRYEKGDYSGMRIGLITGSSRNAQLTQFMAERGFAYTPVYYANMNTLTAALQEGRDIDGAMTSNLRLTDREWILETLNSSPYYAIVRQDEKALLEEIDLAMVRMDTDAAGWRTRLYNKYYSTSDDQVVAFSSEERAYLDGLATDGRVLRATVNPDCAPYSYFENGQAKGIIPDLFAEAAARMGIAYEILQPANREEYQQLCLNGEVDIILDAMDDFDTIERNGLEITEVYYSTPLAVLTPQNNLIELKTLAQPTVSLLNEEYFSYVFKDKTLIQSDCETYADCAARIHSGQADGSYMPYYCAQWLSNEDVTGRLNCLMAPRFERAFVYAVSADEQYELLSSLDKAVGSLSEDYIASVVATNTEYPDQVFSLLGFVYENLVLAAILCVLFLGIVVLALFFADKNRRAQKELQRSRQLERYIGYLCDMYYMVLEIDLELGSRCQYRKRNGVVEIQEENNYTEFNFNNIHPEDEKDCRAVFETTAIRDMAASGQDERYVESRMRTETQDYRWYGFLLKLIARDEQHPCSVMLLIKDVEELHREREQNHETLLRALDAANMASRSKSTFLSSMSHEIRTPLNAMIGYMTIASSAIDNREKVLHCIDAAGVSARHLLSIINDVLDISAMESGKMKLAKERFDLKEQLSAIATVFYQQCRQKNIKFAISINGLTQEWVLGDSMRVNQILMNLMSNAVKFTEKGSVVLTVAQTSQTADQVFIRFVVKDTGIGMSPAYLERLFAPFEQESAQTARRFGGTGLGMSITLNLVNLMGGKIDVESQPEHGSTFTVTLPFGRTENSQLRIAPHDLSHLHVLVVDDLENECDYIHALLDRCGVQAQTAQSGQEAISLLRRYKDTQECFDLCIIDWNMPGLNGVETTKRIHQECDPDIPIIIATAYDISEFEEEALSAGAAKIISKPLFQSTLLDLLVSTYGKYQLDAVEEENIPDLSGMHVLLAEDNETNVEVAIDLLELAGVSADVARNGQEAVELFNTQGQRYDAILMDVQMPILDGYGATRIIRGSHHPQARTIPIIAITADAFAENVAAALAAGMDSHVAKPIETDILFAVLKQAYRKQESR